MFACSHTFHSTTGTLPTSFGGSRASIPADSTPRFTECSKTIMPIVAISFMKTIYASTCGLIYRRQRSLKHHTARVEIPYFDELFIKANITHP